MKNKEKETITQRKSNKSVKTAVLLFGAVLLTTSLLGGTLAKYTGTIGEASDTARVAKWNVDESVQAFDLFSNSYLDKAHGNSSGESNPSGYPITVEGENGDIVIAPGTKGTAEIQIDPTKVTAEEVAYQFTFTVAGDDATATIPFYRNGTSPLTATENTKLGWAVIPDDPGTPTKYSNWLPLRFKITKNGNVEYNGFIGGDDASDNGEEQVKALRTELTNVVTDTIYPNSTTLDITNIIDRSKVTIEWIWEFEEQSNTGSSMDIYDTELGKNAASGEANKVPNFEITIKGTKVQVD